MQQVNRTKRKLNRTTEKVNRTTRKSKQDHAKSQQDQEKTKQDHAKPKQDDDNEHLFPTERFRKCMSNACQGMSSAVWVCLAEGRASARGSVSTPDCLLQQRPVVHLGR